MCIFFVVIYFFLSAAEITNSKLKYMYVLLICLAHWRRGLNWPAIPLYFGMVICTAKAEKMKEFAEVLKAKSRDKKSS